MFPVSATLHTMQEFLRKERIKSWNKKMYRNLKKECHEMIKSAFERTQQKFAGSQSANTRI